MLPIMDCSFPFSSATQCMLQQDKEQLDQQRCSQPQSHHTGHNVAAQRPWVGRMEPLQCRDLLVQNALFSGDLEMVRKYFTRSTAINLIIESRGEELRWTSRKFGGCAEWERRGEAVGNCLCWGGEAEDEGCLAEAWALLKHPGTRLQTTLTKMGFAGLHASKRQQEG